MEVFVMEDDGSAEAVNVVESGAADFKEQNPEV